METAALLRSSSDCILIPVMVSASGIFGVSTSARGIISSINVDNASSCIRAQPPFATMTGSITTCFGRYCFNILLTASIPARVDIMPTFTACTSISSKTAIICFSIISGVISCISSTRHVFSATTDTIALIP